MRAGCAWSIRAITVALPRSSADLVTHLSTGPPFAPLADNETREPWTLDPAKRVLQSHAQRRIVSLPAERDPEDKRVQHEEIPDASSIPHDQELEAIRVLCLNLRHVDGLLVVFEHASIHPVPNPSDDIGNRTRMGLHEAEISPRSQNAIDLVDRGVDVWVDVMQAAHYGHTVVRVVLQSGIENGPEHRLGLGTVLPEVLDGFLGNIEPRHPGAAAQQVAGHLTTPAHGIEHPLPPQVDPRHHWLVEEPQTIRHAERVGIVTLVFLRQAILMPTLFLLRRMLVSRPLVANTFIRLERVPVVQLRPSLVTTVNPMRSPRAHRPNTACGSKRKGRTL